MFGDLWRRLKEQFVIEVPEELFACLDCDFIGCRESKFRDCPNRLAIAARLHAMAEANTGIEGIETPVTPSTAPNPPAETAPASR